MTGTRTPADQRSAICVVFPGPRQVELEEVTVDLGRPRTARGGGAGPS